MTEYIKAWQCIGCGRLEAPQPCLGVCQDRKVLLVGKDEHVQVLAQVEQLERRIHAMRMLLARFVGATPHAGGWERSWTVLQEQARATLEADATRAWPG